MHAKLLNSFSEEITDLEKQIGCMNRIFQIFDGQHLLTRRRLSKKILPSGHMLANNSSNLGVQNSSTPKITLEKTLSKCLTENSSFSMESSSPSCSSSSCSSFSSVDGNKPVQRELHLTNLEHFAKRSMQSSQRLNTSQTEAKETSHDQRCGSTNSGHHLVDFRDIVKDSINHNSRVLTVKTSAKEEKNSNIVKHKDSPRPVLLSKSLDGTYVIGVDRSNRLPAEVTGPGQALREQTRFSCDGREYLPPVDVHDNRRASTKLRELPRLSLDSRKESLSGTNSYWKDFGSSRTDDALLTVSKSHLESLSHRRSNSVIAKLMGLEVESNSSELPVDDRPSRSLRSTSKDQCSVLKSKSSSSTLAESERTLCEFRIEETRPRTASACSAIESRLREFEFFESNKDFRALRILGGLHANELFGTKRESDHCTTVSASEFGNRTPVRRGRDLEAQRSGISRDRDFQSPVVLMKPAKRIDKSDVLSSSVAPVAGLNGLRKLRSGDSSFANRPRIKGQSPKLSPPVQPSQFDLSNGTQSSSNSEGSIPTKIHFRTNRAHSGTEESCASSPRASSSMSPRLLQKADSEKKSRPPVPPLEKNKASSMKKKSNESISPRGRIRSKAPQAKSPDDKVLRVSDRIVSITKQVDISVVNPQQSADLKSSFIQKNVHSPSSRIVHNAALVSNHEEPAFILDDPASEKKLLQLDNVLSPISVLDASFYHDEPLPCLKQISDLFKDGETHTSDECWNPISLPDTPPSKTMNEVHQMKPENLEALIQKLEWLRSEDDEDLVADQIMSSLTDNKDHQYIYEILSASGLLVRDLTVTPKPFQIQSSSYPINPDLFLVLEQTKSELLSAPEAITITNGRPKTNAEKIKRRLMFDLANEIIAEKLYLSSSTNRLVQLLQSKKLSGRQLLKDVCAEIDGLVEESSRVRSLDDGENEENLISREDSLRQMKKWRSFDCELQGMVLDIERSIFKDLIDEIIKGNAARNEQQRQRKLRRQLSFSCSS